MTLQSINKNPEEALTRVLSKFDETSKDTLAVELVKTFNIPSRGRGYRQYLETALGRSLTVQEVFRVDTLMALVKFHGISVVSKRKSVAVKRKAAKKSVRKKARRAAKKARR